MTSRKALSLCNHDTIFTFTSHPLIYAPWSLDWHGVHSFIHFISSTPRNSVCVDPIGGSQAGREDTDRPNMALGLKRADPHLSLSRNAGAECSQHIPPNLHLDRCLKFPSVTSAYGRDGGREGPNTDRELISSAITPWTGDQHAVSVG